MKLKDQVVSLELAKKMKELGFKQTSLFRYYNGDHQKIVLAKYTHGRKTEAKAYTVAELGEMLPIRVEEEFLDCYRTRGKKWECGYGNKSFNIADTEADARAKCLIYLVENNLLTP